MKDSLTENQRNVIRILATGSFVKYMAGLGDDRGTWYTNGNTINGGTINSLIERGYIQAQTISMRGDKVFYLTKLGEQAAEELEEVRS